MKGKHTYFFNFQNKKTNLIIEKYTFNSSYIIFKSEMLPDHEWLAGEEKTL